MSVYPCILVSNHPDAVWQANYRVQLILSADILNVDKEGGGTAEPTMPRSLIVEDTSVEEILAAKTIRGTIFQG